MSDAIHLKKTLDGAVAHVAARKQPVLLTNVGLQTLSTGTFVQTLHIGPFDQDGPALEQAVYPSVRE